MIDYSKISDLIQLCKGKGTNEEIFAAAKRLVEADDGYSYARVWVYGYTGSDNIYVGINLIVKSYNDCPDGEYTQQVIDFVRERFANMNLTGLYIDYVDIDSYLIGTDNYDFIIEKEN